MDTTGDTLKRAGAVAKPKRLRSAPRGPRSAPSEPTSLPRKSTFQRTRRACWRFSMNSADKAVGVRISECRAADTPRERMLTMGAPALSDAELLAVYLNNDVDAARKTLETNGPLHVLTQLR